MSENGALPTEVANLVIRTYIEHFGRERTRGRAYSDGNLVVCLLEDTLSAAERKVVAKYGPDGIREQRRTIKAVMGDRLVAGVEDLTGRRVVAFISAVEPDPDIVAEVFVLDGAIENGATASSDRIAQKSE